MTWSVDQGRDTTHPPHHTTPTSRDVTSNCTSATPLGKGTVAARHSTRPDVTSHPAAGGLQPAGGPQRRVTPHHTSSPHVTSHPIETRRRHIAGGLSQHVTPHDLTSHHPFQERCQSQVGGPRPTHNLTSCDVTSHYIPARPLGGRTIAAHHATRPDVTSLSFQERPIGRGGATRHLTSRDVTSHWIPATPHRRGTVAARHTTRPDVTSPVPGALPKPGRWAGGSRTHPLHSRDITSNWVERRHLVCGYAVTPRHIPERDASGRT